MEFTAWSQVRKGVEQQKYILLDLRSEGEFAKGSIPHARSLPLLDNKERSAVGTLYKTEGKGPATRLGLELFAGKAENFLNQCVSYNECCHRIVLYCWRGGMRSRLVAMWLEAAGIPVLILEGGYKKFRTFVLQTLEELAQQEFLVLNGLTGTGKTKLIQEMIEDGLAAIDFEGIANHRGSAFGGFSQARGTPTQQDFENQLADAFLKIGSAKKILVELENNIGPVSLSKSLRNALCSSPMVYLEKDFDGRVTFLADLYAERWNHEEEQKFLVQMQQVKRFLSTDDFQTICTSIRKQNFNSVITILLKNRYDKAYGKSLLRHRRQMLASFNISYETASAKAYLRQYLTN
ncbi:MAG: tRNA 2-selenouridine(34) synthase MnmH [Oligoflexales bacterium]|nr:tRNA 2-selenouridine(34) synthase MnmH [Oligoflexales bacterium]